MWVTMFVFALLGVASRVAENQWQPSVIRATWTSRVE